jgi:hypothetical protein
MSTEYDFRGRRVLLILRQGILHGITRICSVLTVSYRPNLKWIWRRLYSVSCWDVFCIRKRVSNVSCRFLLGIRWKLYTLPGGSDERRKRWAVHKLSRRDDIIFGWHVSTVSDRILVKWWCRYVFLLPGGTNFLFTWNVFPVSGRDDGFRGF